MWLSLRSLPIGLLEVEHSGSLNLLFLAMQAAEWPCAGSILGDIDHRIFFGVLIMLGAGWMACMATLAARITKRTGNMLPGVLVFVFALFVLLPIWPTDRFVCPSM